MIFTLVKQFLVPLRKCSAIILCFDAIWLFIHVFAICFATRHQPDMEATCGYLQAYSTLCPLGFLLVRDYKKAMVTVEQRNALKNKETIIF